MPAIMSSVTSTVRFWIGCNCSLLELAGLKQIIANKNAEEDKMLCANWNVRGFWDPQKDVFFDDCIFNAESPSLANSSVESLLTTRKNPYLTAEKARRATYTSIIATYDAVFDRDSELSFKQARMPVWEAPYVYTEQNLFSDKHTLW